MEDIRYYVPHVSFCAELFKVDYTEPVDEQVFERWDDKDHLTYETVRNDNLDSLLDMARHLILHTDYNYAAIFEAKYENWGEEDQECIDYDFLGDVRKGDAQFLF